MKKEQTRPVYAGLRPASLVSMKELSDLSDQELGRLLNISASEVRASNLRGYLDVAFKHQLIPLRDLSVEEIRRWRDSGELYAGMPTSRVPEDVGLRDDVDLDASKLQVRRALSITNGGYTFDTPKSGKGRSIKLTS